MKLIVAVDSEWGIGNKGELLAHIREDLLNFKALTTGKTVVLGSKTLSTFPGGKPLKNRNNIILSRNLNYEVENAKVVHSLNELTEEIKNYSTDDVIVIGGAQIYNLLLPYCDTAIVTKFEKKYEADVFLPNLDLSQEWEKVYTSEEKISNKDTDSEPNLKFTFNEYRKKLTC